MDLFLQQLANGLSVGAGYSLFAVGLVLISGILGVLNFVHGGLYLLGGYIIFWLLADFGIGYEPAILISFLTVAIIGAAIARGVVIPMLERGEELATLIALLAVSIVMTNAVGLQEGYFAKVLDSPYSANRVELGSVTLSEQRLILIVAAGAVMILLAAFLRYSQLGRALRATAQNRVGASLVGVDYRNIYMFTFALGAGLAALAGALVAPTQALFPTMGDEAIFKGFVILVIGGLKNVYGVMIAGLAVGVLEAMVSTYITAEYRDLITFALVMAVLGIRPFLAFGNPVRAEV